MSFMEAVALLISALIIIRSLLNADGLRKSVKWLSQSVPTQKPSTRLVVCIPVLNEQYTIMPTLDRFIKQKYPKKLLTIYIVTTEKEKKVTGKPSTREVIERYRHGLNEQDKKRLHVIHYPHKSGIMSHQINYLAQHIKQEMGDDAYFAIYNADSNINNDVFLKADYIISKTAKKPTLLQQSAVYQYNGGVDLSGRIAEGAGLHQSIWTLTHEIPRLLRQSKGVNSLGESLSLRKILRNSRVAHCVGHGLFVRGSFYIQHPLSEDVLNEDLPYGLMACALRETIHSIPSLELASTPSRLVSVYKQKSVWFNPFFEFLGYKKTLEIKGLFRSRRELNFLVFQAYTPLFIWLFHSVVILGGFMLSFLSGLLYLSIWFLAFSAYWFIPALYVTKKRRDLQNGGRNSYVSILAGSIYALSHSLGPILSIFRWIPAAAKGLKPDKPKTEAV